MRINLTQHTATTEQGCQEPGNKSAVQALLTIDEIPTNAELTRRANALALIALEAGANEAMIGGAPFFMPVLERALSAAGIAPVYAFSRREAVDGPDGKKVSVFRHIGFVPAGGI